MGAGYCTAKRVKIQPQSLGTNLKTWCCSEASRRMPLPILSKKISAYLISIAKADKDKFEMRGEEETAALQTACT